jgi:hypothetical protein
MATSLKSISGIGADARKLAKLLQAKAPEGHMLAYINPREAALLKAHGGSGKPHADTGIPSFEEEGVGESVSGTYYGEPDVTTSADRDAAVSAAFDRSGITGQLGYGGASYGFQPPSTVGEGLNAPASFIQPEISVPTSPRYGVDTGRALSAGVGVEERTPEEKSLMAQAAKMTGLKEDTLARLGLAGGMGLLGSRAAGAAARSGQAGAQQIREMAAPYQKQGAELQAQARRGELTPQAMQSLQAAQAQAAQGVERRGGVGTAQATAQIEQLRQQLLQQQYDYGLKLSGIGDNIALGAIKTGLEADRYVQNMNNSFYQNMAYIASGMSPIIRG